MSRRVYEIAWEQNLSSSDVIGRLNDAGIEVKSHLAVVEDALYERVFGDGLDIGAAVPNGRSEAQEADALPSMIQPRRKRSLPSKILMCILAATLAIAVAAGVGALAALIMQGDLAPPGSEGYRPVERQSAPLRRNGLHRLRHRSGGRWHPDRRAGKRRRGGRPSARRRAHTGQLGGLTSVALLRGGLTHRRRDVRRIAPHQVLLTSCPKAVGYPLRCLLLERRWS
jgi:hypothetical protein